MSDSACPFLHIPLKICIENKKHNWGIRQNQALVSQLCSHLSSIRITLLMKDSIKNTFVHGVTCFLLVYIRFY
jgi:hypothetical protein